MEMPDFHGKNGAVSEGEIRSRVPGGNMALKNLLFLFCVSKNILYLCSGFTCAKNPV